MLCQTGSLAYNLTFFYFHCSYQVGPILHHPGRLRHTLFPAKVTIFFRRVFNCHPLLGYVEEELGEV